MTPLFATIDGVQKEMTAIPAMVDGVQRDLSSLFATVDGVAREIFAKATSLLPEGYTQLEYIESTGSQYINTEVIPDQDTRVVFEFEPVEVDQTHLFGSRSSNSASDYFLTLCTGGYYRDDYASYKLVSTVAPSGAITIDKNKNIVTIDGQTLQHAYATFKGTYPIFLFASNTGGNASNHTKLRCKSCKIYQGAVLVRDYVPGSKSEPGLYDLVGDKFYTSEVIALFVGGPTVGNNTGGNTGGSTDGIISFTIEGVEYNADSGMTWAEWVASDYNVDGYFIPEEGSGKRTDRVFTANGSYVVVYGGTYTVAKITEVIVANGDYDAIF